LNLVEKQALSPVPENRYERFLNNELIVLQIPKKVLHALMPRYRPKAKELLLTKLESLNSG
jgi:hypothetical protein